MFCNKCGSQLPDNAAFCGNCGNTAAQAAPAAAPTMPVQPEQPYYAAPAPVQPEQPYYADAAQGYAEPAPAKKKSGAAKILIPVIAVVLVAAIAVTAVATGGFGLLKKKGSDHPVGALWGGVKQLLMTETGFNAKADIKQDEDDYEFAVEYDLSVLWGKDLRSSVGAFSSKEIETGYSDYIMGYVFRNNEVAAWDEYKGDIDYEYGSEEGAEDFYDTYDRYYGLGPVFDKAVQDGKLTLLDSKGNWNTEHIAAMAGDFVDMMAYESDLEYLDLSKAEKITLLSQALDLLDGFFIDYCGQKEVQDEIFRDLAKTTSGGLTTFRFRPSLRKLISAAEDYLLAAVEDEKYTDLVDLAEEIIRDSGYRNLKTLIKSYAAELRDEAGYFDQEYGSLFYELTIDRQGRIVAAAVDLGEEGTFALSVTNYGNPQVNNAELDDRIADAKADFERRQREYEDYIGDGEDLNGEYLNW